MSTVEQKRRSLLFSLGVLTVSQVFPHSSMEASTVRHGYVLGANEGEHSFIFGTVAISSSKSAGAQTPTILPWGPNKSWSARAFRFTDIFKWMKFSMCWRGAAFLALTM